MSRKPHKPAVQKMRTHAPLFAALGDDTRLLLLAKLSAGFPASITHLTQGSPLTRQAITKHLRVLQTAGLLYHTRQGRETLFQLNPQPLQEAQRALERISHQWDQALARLKSFVEK